MSSTEYPMPTLGTLISGLPQKEILNPQPDLVPSELTADSRHVIPGAVFVAVRGTQSDGHTFIPAAVSAGAAAIVCEQLPESPAPGVTWVMVPDSSVALGIMASARYGNPSRELTLVGVTGTNGKTTVATLLYDLARLTGHHAGLLSTVVNKIDDTEVPSTHTTPDPLALNALLRRMADAGCDFAAMEVSSHAASQHRIAGLDFDGAIFTNLTRDHLDYHGTVANYLAAKKSFFDNLKPEAFAVTNIDDKNGAVMLQNTRAKRVTYSLRSDADHRGRLVEDRIDGMTLAFDGREAEMMFIGRFNAANLMAVYATGRCLGLDRDTLLTAMSRLTPVAGRFQPFRSPSGVVGIVDYAHTPDAIINVLDTINEIKPASASVTAIVGCGGDRDRGKRPIMACEAAERASRLIITSDNPRTEDPMSIIADMRAGLTPEQEQRTLTVPDRAEAIRLAVQLAAPGDVILLAGKGHETYQIIGTEKLPFDDRAVLAAALSAK